MMPRKAQAALEFIMTYGWAVLVVMVAIGTLAYFGILNPDKLLPSKCFLPKGFACVDYTARSTDGTIDIMIKNGFSSDLTDLIIVATDCLPTSVSFFGKNDQQLFSIAGCTFVQDQKYFGDLNLTYVDSLSGINHTSYGVLHIRVE